MAVAVVWLVVGVRLGIRIYWAVWLLLTALHQAIVVHLLIVKLFVKVSATATPWDPWLFRDLLLLGEVVPVLLFDGCELLFFLFRLSCLLIFLWRYNYVIICIKITALIFIPIRKHGHFKFRRLLYGGTWISEVMALVAQEIGWVVSIQFIELLYLGATHPRKIVPISFEFQTPVPPPHLQVLSLDPPPDLHPLVRVDCFSFL